MRRRGLLIRALVVLFATILAPSGSMFAQDSQWRSYGGDDGRSTKYAPSIRSMQPMSGDSRSRGGARPWIPVCPCQDMPVSAFSRLH